MQDFYKQPFTGYALLAMLAFACPSFGQQPGASAGNSAPLTGSPGLTPIPSPNTTPNSTLQPPTYDPYATPSGTSPAVPSLSAPPSSGAYGTGVTTNPQPYTYGQPPASPYGQPYPGYGSASPPVLFPNGLFGPSQPSMGAAANPLRMFQNLDFSYTWLYGRKDRVGELNITDIYLSTTATFPNFLWSGQPWFVSPGFGWHDWSGPWDASRTDISLAPRAYSAFLDVGWRSDPNTAFGAEFAGRIGVFSDFSQTTSDSLRLQGIALLRYNLTPSVAIKGGVSYIDRLEIKMLPAAGVLWTPNPHTRFDIFFPQPKLATYLTTLATRDVWWYLAGEYGGGSWTITTDASRQTPPGTDVFTRMDINDWRVMIGLELQPPGAGASSLGQRSTFVEAGYVFKRKLILRDLPDYSLKDTFMLRGGFTF